MPRSFIGPLLKNGRRRINKKRSPLSKKEKSQVVSIAKKVILNQSDLHYVDLYNNVIINNAGTVLKVTDPISLGDDASQREGYEITARSLELNMTIEGGLSQVNYATVRVVLIKDTAETYGGTPPYAGVFESAIPESPFLYTAVKSGRFKVMMDRMIQVAPSVNTTTVGLTSSLTANPAGHVFRIKKKLNHKIFWDQGSLAGKGHMYIVCISDLGTNSGNTNPKISAYTRMYFSD